MKHQILLNNYCLPGELQQYRQRFVSHDNHERYRESLNNLTFDNLIPADVFYGRKESILEQRELIKQNTLAMRKKMHYSNQRRPLTRSAKPSLSADGQTFSFILQLTVTYYESNFSVYFFPTIPHLNSGVVCSFERFSSRCQCRCLYG